jgi:hypothetical protein
VEPLLIAGLIAFTGPLTAAILTWRGRNNNRPVNPRDPDKTPVGQVSVGWFMAEIKRTIKTAIKESADD